MTVSRQRADWTPEERLAQALSAADYSHDVHPHRYSDGFLEERRYAKEAHGLPDDGVLTNKLLDKG